jgi:hypothetical protein
MIVFADIYFLLQSTSLILKKMGVGLCELHAVCVSENPQPLLTFESLRVS